MPRLLVCVNAYVISTTIAMLSVRGFAQLQHCGGLSRLVVLAGGDQNRVANACHATEAGLLCCTSDILHKVQVAQFLWRRVNTCQWGFAMVVVEC